jgi:energy-coupling factor transporter transmembrane protein EcfT
MVNLIKYRAFLITAIFGLFGGALTSLLNIEELKSTYIGLSLLISLVISLLISFFLKLKWTRKTRDRVKMISLALFLLMLVAMYFFIKTFNNNTFYYKDIVSKKGGYYVKGDELQDNAKSYMEAYQKAKGTELSPEQLIIDKGGPENADQVWRKTSINNNKLGLLVSYSLLVITFVSSVCLLTEVLASRYKKSTEKSIEKTTEEDKKS